MTITDRMIVNLYQPINPTNRTYFKFFSYQHNSQSNVPSLSADYRVAEWPLKKPEIHSLSTLSQERKMFLICMFEVSTKL